MQTYFIFIKILSVIKDIYTKIFMIIFNFIIEKNSLLNPFIQLNII